MTRLLLAACIGASALALTACTKTEAKTPGPAPISLKVPEPPGRLNIPVQAEPPPPPPATEKPAPPAAPATRPARPTPTPPPTATPPATNTETPPVVQAGGQAEAETRARERLAVAETNIAKVQRENLPREARDQFDSAKQFISMTRSALQARNFVYAAYCADKAATLAVLLVKSGAPR